MKFSDDINTGLDLQAIILSHSHVSQILAKIISCT